MYNHINYDAQWKVQSWHSHLEQAGYLRIKKKRGKEEQNRAKRKHACCCTTAVLTVQHRATLRRALKHKRLYKVEKKRVNIQRNTASQKICNSHLSEQAGLPLHATDARAHAWSISSFIQAGYRCKSQAANRCIVFSTMQWSQTSICVTFCN